MGWVIWLVRGAILVASYLLYPRNKKSTPAREAPFESPRSKEGDPIPVVFGAAEIAPNIVYVGNIREEPVNERRRYYASMFGVLAHGPLDQLVDIKFGDYWLSEAKPEHAEFGPPNIPLSVDLPYDRPGDSHHLEIMVNAGKLFGGGPDEPDGHGGVAGHIHLHWGVLNDVVCEFSNKWFTRPDASAFPGVCYITFGWGEPNNCLSRTVGDDWATPQRWIVVNSPYDRVFGLESPFNYTNPLAVGQDSAGHGVYFYPRGRLAGRGTIGTMNATWGQLGEWGDQSTYPITVDQDSYGNHPPNDLEHYAGSTDALVLANASYICPGCVQGYTFAYLPFNKDCLTPGQKLRIRFKYSRLVDFHWFRWPHEGFRWCDPTHGASILGGGAWYSSSMGLTNGIKVNVWENPDSGLEPGGDRSWDEAGDFPPPQSPCNKVGVVLQFDSTFTVQSDTNHPFWTQGDDEGSTAYFQVGYSAFWWKSAWWAEMVWDLEIIGFPEDWLGPYTYMPAPYNYEGIFYWGLDPTPPPPLVLVKRIPTAVSGAGVNQGANPADCLYDILTNAQWGLSLAPSLIDLTSFQTAATTLADEGLGISFVMDTPQEAERWMDEILSTCEGLLYSNPQTGLLTMKLLRPDYTIGSLPTYDADDLHDIEVTRPTASELFNEVKLNYRRWRQGDDPAGDPVTITLPLVSPNYWYVTPAPGYDPSAKYYLGVNSATGVGATATQSATTLVNYVDDPSDYAWDFRIINDHVILNWNAPNIDWDGPALINLTFYATTGRPGFDDAAATAWNQAMFAVLGEIRSDVLDFPMLMDANSAQRVAERHLKSVSRPLASVRWKMRRAGSVIYPGAVVKLNLPEYKLTNVPVRVTEVDYGTLDSATMELAGVEDRWGSNTTMFGGTGAPNPETSQCPVPLAFSQVNPSNVRLYVEAADEFCHYEFLRSNNIAATSFLASDWGAFQTGYSGTGTFSPPSLYRWKVSQTGANQVVDDTPPDTQQYYYWVRHYSESDNRTPSAWLGPVIAVHAVGIDPPPGKDPERPIAYWWAYDDWAVTQKTYVLVRLDDPDNRAGLGYFLYRVPNFNFVWNSLEAYLPPHSTAIQYQWEHEIKALYTLALPQSSPTTRWYLATIDTAYLDTLYGGLDEGAWVDFIIYYTWTDGSSQYLSWSVHIDIDIITDDEGGPVGGDKKPVFALRWGTATHADRLQVTASDGSPITGPDLEHILRK